MKKLLAATGILFMAMLVVFTACSDKSTKNNMTEGDYNSDEYRLARQDADSTLADLTNDQAEVGGWLGWTPGSLDVDTVGYDSTDGWHYRFMEYVNEYIIVSDSDWFRFTSLDTTYQRHYDSLTNIFERRLHRTLLFTPMPDSQNTFWSKNFKRNMHWQGLADSVTTVNGEMDRTWVGQADGKSYSRAIQGELTDVQVYTADLRNGRPNFPFSGTLSGQMELNVVTPNRQVHVVGTLTITFYRDHYHARLVRGDNYWEWDHYYGP